MVPDTLVCTVTGSTTILFNASGSSVTHQIISTSNPQAFPSSAAGFSTFGFALSISGTYPYQDAFNAQIKGRIIIQ